MGRARSPVAVAAAAMLVLVAVLAWSLSKSGHHRTGTNGVPRQRPIFLSPRRGLCQGGELVAKGSARVRFFPADKGGRVGPFEVTLRPSGGRSIATTPVPAHDYAQSEAAVATFPPLPRAVPATVCVRNAGSSLAAVEGDFADQESQAVFPESGPRGKTPPVRMHFDYQLPKATSWWSFAPTIARRFGLMKATFFGSWTLWFALAALAALALGVAAYAVRALGR
jgi:hypothetical protein